MDEVKPARSGPVCYWHQYLPAVARCVSCGRNICSDCSVMMQGRNYCRYCSSTLFHQQYYYPQAQPAGYQPFYRKPKIFKGVDWGVGEAVIIYIIAFLLANVGSVVIALLLVGLDSQTAIVLLVFLSTIFLNLVLTGSTFYSIEVRHGSNLSAIGLKGEGAGKSLLWGLAAGVLLFAGAYPLGLLIQYLIQFLFEIPETTLSRSFSEISGTGTNPLLIFLFVFTIVVIAPIFEEIFFRGYLYPALRNRLGMQPSMLINGALFAAAHLDPFGFLPRMLLGYGLSFIFEKKRNLAGPMLAHAIYNGIILVIAFLL